MHVAAHMVKKWRFLYTCALPWRANSFSQPRQSPRQTLHTPPLLARTAGRRPLRHACHPQTAASTSRHLAELKGKAAYTRSRGLNPVRYAEMVREYLQDHQRIENVHLRELLGLGDSPSARVEASRYLRRWSDEGGFLTKQTGGGKPFYTLKKPKAPSV